MKSIIAAIRLMPLMVRSVKSALADYVAERREQLRKEYGFDPNNGTAQIDYGLMWRQAKILAYGEYDALARLADRFNLE